MFINIDNIKKGKKYKVAFDVDMTLIHEDGSPIKANIDMLRHCVNSGWDIYIWSGGGVSYVERRVNQLRDCLVGVNITIIPKTLDASKQHGIEICFDDQEVSLAEINIQIPYNRI